MSGKIPCIIQLPKGETLQKGMAEIKQVLASIVVVMVAAGILTGMVLYSVFLMRSAELQILTGERTGLQDPREGFGAYNIHD